ncbi:MAG TPA: protein kinase [Gemmatimonadaceae bacterium]|nr:protein kinase [Gemmatimonadaceae bacterium]
MEELKARLQAALGDDYVVERELGGGGMARVFVARDVSLGRDVAVKVLPPDLGAAVNAERFRREIQVAARLQHPLVVPVLAAGEGEGLLYYTMPLVEGESLRARLRRVTSLSPADTIRVLCDVASALAYAHARGIVHRDIKPDNVLLSGGHALVADFGVAKAVSEAAASESPNESGSGLTSVGIALGTPAYMAPEQALADPDADHRVDVYAAGILGYEMLAGRPPFAGMTPQATVAAQVSSLPPSLADACPDAPAALVDLLMRCLEKRPADRFESADALRAALDDLPVSGARPSGVVGAATNGGNGGRGTAVGSGGAGGQRPMPRRGRAVLVAATLALLVGGGYATLRALGVVPGSSLVSEGVMHERERVLVADFDNRTNDRLLGDVVTDAFRTDLTQSPAVTVVQPDAVRDVLARMQQPAAEKLTPALAREVAERDNIKVLVTGDVGAAGAGYVLTARLVSAPTGEVIEAFRETAEDARGVIPAIDRLSKTLRARVGESLRAVRTAPRLADVSTASLPALRKYSEGVWAADRDGNELRGAALLEEAVALDTTFAMAYRKLAMVYSNRGERPERATEALRKAFQYRDRLSESERYLLLGTYYSHLEADTAKAVAAYQSLLELDPNNAAALNNLGMLYYDRHDYAAAESLYRRAMGLSNRVVANYENLAQAQYTNGEYAAAESTVAALRAFAPRSPAAIFTSAELAGARGDYAAADSVARGAFDLLRGDAASLAKAGQLRAAVATIFGKLGDAERMLHDASASAMRAANPGEALSAEGQLVVTDVLQRGRPDRGAARLERTLARHPLDSLPAATRPYLNVALLYALVDRPAPARAAVAKWDRTATPAQRAKQSLFRRGVEGMIALAEKRPAAAVTELRAVAAEDHDCVSCVLPALGVAYVQAGNADSAIAVLERYLVVRDAHRLQADQDWLAISRRRLGELYEARGDKAQAVKQYAAFLDLWRDADPELQPQVAEVRRRLIALGGESVVRPVSR